MTRVKICGITRVDDARLAAELGAAAIGFVFADSPRRVTVDAARRIVAALPVHVDRVGVFVDASRAEIVEVAAAVSLTRVQLHGREPPELAAGLPGALTRTLRADDDEAEIARWRFARPDVHFLLDRHKDAAEGEESLPILWQRAAVLARVVPIALGGGLTPQNVTTALERSRAAAVDVARGVELAPGRKDRAKLRSLFAAIAAFDAGAIPT
jgi:phosphoribosylanthranilate isomerase